MKRFRFLGALAVAAFLLPACSSDKSSDTTVAAADTTAAAADTTAAPAETAAADTTAAVADTTVAAATDSAAAPAAGAGLIGLVTDLGKVDDKSFNQSAWEGAQAAATELGVTAEFIESSDQKDYGPNIKQLIDKGATTIITVGFALGEETAKAATANPNIKFIGVDQFQGTEIANYSGLVFPEDKAGFMAGALAGLMTKTNKIAAVLGTDTVPPVKRFGEGFKNGVKFTNAGAEVIVTYHEPNNAFGDPAWGATTAEQALDNGADVIFGAGGATGNGALAEIAKKDGALCIGVDTDQYETVPESRPCLLTSAMKMIKDGVVTLVKQAADGSMKGGNFTGAVGLAPYHDQESKVSADVKTKIDGIIADVLSGTTPTGVS